VPYEIKKDDRRCPASHPWAVVKKDGQGLIACHDTQTKAEKQIEAIGAREHGGAAP